MNQALYAHMNNKRKMKKKKKFLLPIAMGTYSVPDTSAQQQRQNASLTYCENGPYTTISSKSS
jgi:hypothetical protein